MDMQIVQKRLEEAGLYDQNLKKEEMLAYYNVVKDSECTALEEDKSRIKDSENFVEKADSSSEEMFVDSTPPKSNTKPFNPKQWVSDKKDKSQSSENNNDNTLVDENSENMQTISSREKYDLDNAQKNFISKLEMLHPFNNPKTFFDKSVEERANIIYNYHNDYAKQLAILARYSFIPAPKPKLITASYSNVDIFDDALDFQETYVSRSGRQTKRKNYNLGEDFTDLNGISSTTKKSKPNDEDEWLSKKSIKAKKVETPTTSTPNRNETPSSSGIEIDIPKDKATPKSEYKPRKKLSNEDIINRSALFSDVVKPSRKEALMEKTKVENEKKRKEEIKMELFENSLIKTDEEQQSEDVINIEDEEPFVKRRVAPTLPISCRRGIGRKRNKQDENPLDITVEPSTSKSIDETLSIVKEQTEKKLISLRKNKNKSEDSDIVSSGSSSVTCPICNQDFEKTLIAEHASSCGDFQEVRSTRRLGKITCEVCDKVFPMDTNYEGHVVDCLAEKKRQLARSRNM